MADAPKSFSERLDALAKDFNAISGQIAEANKGLTTAAFYARSAEFNEEQNRALREYVDDLNAVNGHDVIFLVNKSKPMGEGYHSASAAAAGQARDLSIASGASQGRDLRVTLSAWDKDFRTYSFSSSLEKIYEKAGPDAADFTPVARDILTANTPDKQQDRNRHYVVISAGNITDSVDNAAQMLNTALALNPKATIDFINVGSGEGNIRDLHAKLALPTAEQASGLYTAEKPADIKAAVIRALKGRLVKNQAPAVEPPAPKPQISELDLTLVAHDGPPVDLTPKPETTPATPAAAEAPAKKGWSRLKFWGNKPR